jgi:hypothetical protein
MAQLHRSLLLIFQLIAILCALFRSINLKNVTFPWFIVIVSSFKCPRRGRSFFPGSGKVGKLYSQLLAGKLYGRPLTRQDLCAMAVPNRYNFVTFQRLRRVVRRVFGSGFIHGATVAQSDRQISTALTSFILGTHLRRRNVKNYGALMNDTLLGKERRKRKFM